MQEPTAPTDSVVVVLSGGQDSTTTLAWATDKFKVVHAVTFDYGQRHKVEIKAAKKIAKLYEVASHEIIELPAGILGGTSPLVSNNDLEQYKDSNSLPGGVEKTFVPCRNQLFLTLAANRAFILDCQNLVTGVCEEDYGGYPDCRQTFIDSLERTLNLGTFTGEDWVLGPITIHTPLMNLTKAESIQLAIDLGAYADLAFTHTSYDGQFPPTGHDHATLLRAKGFLEHGSPDPLVLRAWKLGLMELPETDNYSSTEVAIALDALEGTYGEEWYNV